MIVVYAARPVGEASGTSEEVSEVRWFSRDELPWEEFAFESTALALQRFLTGSRGAGA